MAGLMFGFSIHFKVYPIILSLLFYLYIGLERKFLNINSIWFTIYTLLSLLSITYYFYLKYGWEFLYESTLYHFERKDFKHNYSPS